MLRIFVVFCLFSYALSQSPSANDFCFQCKEARNNKDLYANPEDCHTYYQCFYTGEEGVAEGHLRKCANGTFWNDYILQCVPEGSTPCTDPCRAPDTDSHGCLGSSTNCAQFWMCHDQTSYAFCCPSGTSFDNELCACVACTDVCTREGPTQPSTVAPPQLFDGYCIDSFGNKLRAVEGDDSKFQQINPEDDSVAAETECAPGSKFLLADCTCSVAEDVGDVPQYKQCTLYLPFDEDTNDHSIYKYYVDVSGAEQQNSVAARGSGSLLNGASGRLELPGAKSRHEAYSACVFFRCENMPCNYSSTIGGLFSKRECSDCVDSAQVSAIDSGKFHVEVVCNRSAPLVTDFPLPPTPDSAPSGFFQLCLTYSGSEMALYFNNQRIMAAPLTCKLPLSPCPFFAGFDAIYGSFQGYLDEILFCGHSIGVEGVDAHYQGQDALRAAGLIP